MGGELVDMMKWLSNYGTKYSAEYKNGTSKTGLGEDTNWNRPDRGPKCPPGGEVKINCRPEFDCTGLITAALWRFGIKVPRLATFSIPTSGFFTEVEKEELQPDDIIVFPGHAVGAVTGYKNGKGTFFGMQTCGGAGFQDFGPGTYWPQDWKAYRLKEEYRTKLKIDPNLLLLMSFNPYTCSSPPKGWPAATKPEGPNRLSVLAADQGGPASTGSE